MIYQRHIVRALLSHLGVVLGSIILVIWLSQIMKLSFIIELGSSTINFLFLSLSAIPSISVSLIPIAIGIAYFGQFSFFSSDRELTTMSASGLSNWQIAMPAIKLSCMISIVGYLLAFYVAPTSYHFLKRRLNNFHDHYFKNVIHTGTFNPISKNFTIYIDHKKSGNILSEIIIFDNRNARENAIIFAKEGKLYLEKNTPTFKLFDGTRQVIDRKGNMNQMTFEDLKISLPKGKTERAINSMEMMEYNIFQLLFADRKQVGPKKNRQINAELHQRLTWSGYSVVIALITLGLFLNKPYTRSPEYKTAVKVTFVCIFVLYMHFAFHNMASKNNIYIIFTYLNLFLSGSYGYFLLNKKRP